MKNWSKYFLILYYVIACTITHAQKNKPTNQQLQAIQFLDSVSTLRQSLFWSNINPEFFLQNVKNNIYKPAIIYGGNGTNFCGYAAFSYSFINNYPEMYARFMVALYNNGKASVRKVKFNPSLAVKKAAGTFKFKGELDVHPADQMWFLSLADNFKGYVNFFNHKYHPGNEDGLWASTNFSKFNRMLRRMCNYEVKSVGWDLIRPSLKSIPAFLKEKLQTAQVFVYLNNTILHKKNHNHIRKMIPTHYVALLDIEETNGLVTLIYWDYGFKTLQQLTPQVLNNIVYGITWCTKKDNTL